MEIINICNRNRNETSSLVPGSKSLKISCIVAVIVDIGGIPMQPGLTRYSIISTMFLVADEEMVIKISSFNLYRGIPSASEERNRQTVDTAQRPMRTVFINGNLRLFPDLPGDEIEFRPCVNEKGNILGTKQSLYCTRRFSIEFLRRFERNGIDKSFDESRKAFGIAIPS